MRTAKSPLQIILRVLLLVALPQLLLITGRAGQGQGAIGATLRNK